MMTIAQRALARIRDEMAERRISQRDLADRLQCSQGRIAKMLNGHVNLRLMDLELLARAVGIAVTETVRDRGLEFYAEMTPTELRMLERLRQRPQAMEAIRTLLQVEGPVEQTAVTPKPGKVGRPRHSARGK